MKKWITMYVQISETSDRNSPVYIQISEISNVKPVALGIFNDRNTAMNEIYRHMQTWYSGMHIEDDEESLDDHIDFCNLTAIAGNTRCDWNIQEIEIPA